MRRILIDGEGNLRCWRCGARGFTAQRPAGLFARKLNCAACGTGNGRGKPKPFRGAAGPQPARPSGWYPDPRGPGERYWDSVRWTDITR